MTLLNKNKITFLKEPFEHIIIEDYYSEQEIAAVTKEIIFISESNSIEEADTRNTAVEDNVIQAKRRCVFLHDMFVAPEKSLRLPILNFKYDKVKELREFGILGRQVALSNQITTLISFYRDGDYYTPHFDDAYTTQIIYLWPGEKDFDGGELYFPEFDYEITVKNNSCLYFPGAAVHGVKPIVSKNLSSNSIKRVSVTTFRSRVSH